MGKSNRLQLSSIRRIFDILGEMRELRHDTSLARRHMLFRLCQLVDARQSSVVELAGWSPTGQMELIEVAHGGWMSPEAAQMWEGVILANNPRLDILVDRCSQVPGAVRTRLREEVISDEEWFASDNAHTIAKHAQVSHQLMCWFVNRSTRASGLTLHRTWGDKRFSVRERRILELFNIERYRLHRSSVLRVNQMRLNTLSPREHDVLEQLVRGKSVKEAASAIGIRPRTAEDYVKAIYKKLQVNSRAELLSKLYYI